MSEREQGDDVYYSLERTVYQMEQEFLNVIAIISRDFYGPLKAFLQTQYTQGILNGTEYVSLTKEYLSAIFDPLVSRLQVAVSVLSLQKLKPLVDRRQHFWIADVYAESPDYISSYQGFLDSQTSALAKLEAIRSTLNHPLRTALDSASRIHYAKKERFTDYSLEDLLWYCSARVTHLHKICASQHALWQETQRAQCDLVSAKFFTNYGRDLDDSNIERAFYAELRNMQNPQHWAFACTTGWTRSRGMPEPTGTKGLETLVAAAAGINATHKAKDMERSVIYDSRFMPVPLPKAPQRRFTQRLPARLIDSADYGLSAETPAWLLLFTDVLVVAVANDRPSATSKETYRMSTWLDLRTINVIAVDTVSGRRFYKVTSHIPDGESTSSSSSDAPVGGSEVVVTVEIACKDFEVWSNWNLTFTGMSKECTGVVPNKECNEAHRGYPTVGMNLSSLVALEARRHPMCALGGIPLLVSRAIGGILRYGLGEEGILRLSCEQQAMNSVLATANGGGITSIYFTKETVHVASAVFKQFLRGLPEPLIPYAFYDDFIALAENDGGSNSANGEDKQQRLITLVNNIPEPYKTVLREVCHLFYVISCSSDINKMIPSNIAIAAGVSLLRKSSSVAVGTAGITDLNKSASVIEMMIQGYPEIFDQGCPFWGTPGRSVVTWAGDSVTPYVGLLHKHMNTVPIVHLALQESAGGLAAVWAVDKEGSITLYDPDGGYRVVDRRPAGFRNPLALLSADSMLCVSCESKRGLYILDTGRFTDEGPESYAPVAHVDGPPAHCAIVADSKNSGVTLWCGADNVITITSRKTLGVIKTIDLRKKPRTASPEITSIKIDSCVVTCMVQINDTVWCGVHINNTNTQVINVYDLKEFNLIASFTANKSRITALCPIKTGDDNCSRVWSGGEDGGVIIWDVESRTQAAALPHAHSGGITAMSMVGSGTVWTSGKDSTMRIWGVKSLRYIGEVCGYHALPVTSMICFDKSVKLRGYTMIWTSSMDGSVCAWKVLQFPSTYLQ